MTETAQEPVAVEHEEPVVTPPELEDDDESLDDDEALDEPHEPEQEGAEPLSEKALEQAMVKLDKESTRHANRITEIMGDDALELVPCPRCAPAMSGFIYPPEMVPPPDEVKQAVRASLGEPGVPDFAPLNGARTCNGCHGLGSRTTGSLVPGQQTIMCPDCPNGRGWIGEEGTRVYAPPASNGETAGASSSHEPVANDNDPFGRPPHHPKYGVMPQYDPTYRAADYK